MRKIKLIKCDFSGCSECYENICSSCSDWEEVSEETFLLLKSWEGQRTLSANGVFLVVLEDVTHTVDDYIKDITQFVQKEKDRLEKLKKQEEKRRAEAKTKRDIAKIEKARKLLKERGEL